MSHSPLQVASHHRELVEVGNRSEGISIGPERDRSFGFGHGFPAFAAQEPERSVDRVGSARASRPRINIEQGRKVELCRILVNDLPSAQKRLGRGPEIPLLPQLGHVDECPDLWIPRHQEPGQVRLDLRRNAAAEVERDRGTNQETQARSA